jgi:VanZ family protein
VTRPGRTSSRWARARTDRLASGRRRAVLVLVVLVQLAVLYDPTAPSVGGLSSVPGLDKVVHAGLFALVMVAGRTARLPRVPLLLLTVVQAPVSEIVQATLLPGRSGDPWDVVADLAGCLLGWWLARRNGDDGHA